MAQFEREMTLERQWEGIAKAKAQGKAQGVGSPLLGRRLKMRFVSLRMAKKGRSYRE
jgi:DNA invertase Pin-like site-specific DNA recombinase